MKRPFMFAVAVIIFVLLLVFPSNTFAQGEDPRGGLVLEDIITPETGVWWSLVIVAVAIAADTILGVLLGLKNKEFDVRILPQFILTGILPYLGGLLILTGLAHFVSAPFAGMYYTAAVFVVGKYVKDLWDKLKQLFGPGIVPGE